MFDRGGWSPKLFHKLLEAHFDILTYRKGKCRRIAAQRFIVRSAQIEGHTVEYRLHDQRVRFLKGKLRLRQVSRLSDNGHQTQVITSRWDLTDILASAGISFAQGARQICGMESCGGLHPV